MNKKYQLTCKEFGLRLAKIRESRSVSARQMSLDIGRTKIISILSNQEKIIQAWYIFLIFVNICILHHRLSLIQGMNKHFL